MTPADRDQPLYDQTAADLADDPLADCPPSGPIDSEREPQISFEDDPEEDGDAR